MKLGSLRARLLGLAALTIAVALGLAWLALSIIFERHIRDRLGTELGHEIVWIAANLDLSGGEPSLRSEPPDPRFQRPFGGLYWQVGLGDGQILRSRSLWDETLPEPPDEGATAYDAAGPRERLLFLRAEDLVVTAPGGEQSVQVIVAADHSEIDEPVFEFGRDLAAALIMIAIALTIAAAVQVSIGLAPLQRLRKEVAAIRARQASRLGSRVPSEVRPLVEEVNELLDAQDAALDRARAQAGDLAHGLKTPLTVLSNVATKLGGSNGEHAAIIQTQVEAMRRRIDRQLARARLGAEKISSSRVAPLVERLVDLMGRTPRGEHIEWDLKIDPELVIDADEVDAAEAIGNVLENACKWSDHRIRITAEGGNHFIAVCVEDDGPGVPAERRDAIVERGFKLSEQVEGSGLGLAIVNDILSAYGGRLDLSNSELGGLQVRVIWPARAPAETSAEKASR